MNTIGADGRSTLPASRGEVWCSGPAYSERQAEVRGAVSASAEGLVDSE